DVRVANIGTGGRLHVELDGADQTGPIAIPDTGGWQSWRTITTAGIPMTAGLHVIRVVFDAAGTSGGVGNYNWFRVGAAPPPAPNTPFGGTAASLPGTFQAENFDEGGPSIAYSDTTSGNAGGVYRSTDVDLEATTDSGAGYNVMKTRAGEWLKYTVDVATAGTYAIDVRVANIGTGGRLHVELDGADQTGPIAIPDTGGWQSWRTITTAGIPMTPGLHVIRVVFDAAGTSGGVGNYNWFRVGTATTGSSARSGLSYLAVGLYRRLPSAARPISEHAAASSTIRSRWSRRRKRR
ncbi:MAG TPA: carbohydrate-binding protein, partial [Vicinamibacterales bacterium]|nr:carbohydrate-binding protein [Vicinamibacterales bacterium]